MSFGLGFKEAGGEGVRSGFGVTGGSTVAIAPTMPHFREASERARRLSVSRAARIVRIQAAGVEVGVSW
jgi:hypothetical protein